MAVDWGPWEYSGGNGMRVGIEVSVETITHGDTGCTFTVQYWTENQHTYGDDQTLSLSGAIDGSISINNNDGSSPVARGSARTYTYNYGSTEYGSSPGNRSFTVKLSGAYNGVTPSNTVTRAIPARPYAAPDPPSSVTAARVSDTSIKVSWVRHATSGEPYESHTLQRVAAPSSTYGNLAYPTGSATTYTDASAVANKRYRYQIRANNDAGSSGFVASSTYVWTTPAAPSTPSRIGSPGANQLIGWTNNVGYSEYQTEVWHAANGVWDSAPLATLAAGVTGYTHTAPSASVRHKYRVRAKTTSGTLLYSAYSAESTETAVVSATSPPSAPSGLAPNNTTIDQTAATVLTWTHNPTDGSAQTKYQVRHRQAGTTTWTTSSVISSATASYTLPANTYPIGVNVEWQVLTYGNDPNPSPWSPSASFFTATVAKIPLQLNLMTGRVEASMSGSIAGGGGGGTGQVVACLLKRAVSQSIPDTGAYTLIAWDTEVYDTLGLWAVSQATRLIAPVTGKYHLSTQMYINLGANRAVARVYKNAAGNVASSNIEAFNAQGNGISNSGIAINTDLDMVAGDYLEIGVLVAGAAVTTTAGEDGTWAALHLISGGPPGPQGPAGPPGSTPTVSYQFNQATPLATWVIDHPLGFRPNVTVVDSSGHRVEGDITYVDADTISIAFTAAFAGAAYLS